MRPLSILLQQYFSALGTIVPKSFTGAFSSNSRPWCSWSLSRICKGVIKLFWNEVFMVRNTVSWCLAIICRKWSAFDMKFHLIVVLLFLKTCVKDYGDRGLVISYRKGVQLVQCKICHAWFLLTPPPPLQYPLVLQHAWNKKYVFTCIKSPCPTDRHSI